MSRILLALALLLWSAVPVAAQSGVNWKNGSTFLGRVTTIECGSGITCAFVGGTGTLTVTGGGSPTGAAGGDLGGTYPNPTAHQLTGSNAKFGFNTPGYPEIVTDGASLANANFFDGGPSAFTIHQGTQNPWPFLIWNDVEGITKGIAFSASDRAFGIDMGDGAGGSTEPFALTDTALTLTTSLTVGTRTGTPATFATFDSGGKLVAGGSYSDPAFITPGGRCTLTSGTPVTSADVTSSTNVYYTPYTHNNIWLYTSGAWKHYTFSEITIALGTLTSGKNYDIFLYDSGGNVTAKIGPAWTSDTGRGTGAGTSELAQQDGAWVNNVAITSGPGAKNGLHVCTFRTISTTATADSGGGVTTQVGGKRFLDNMYQRVPGTLIVNDTTSTWSYTTGTIRGANGATGVVNAVEFINGQPWGLVDAVLVVQTQVSSNSAAAAGIGVTLDSRTTFGFQSAGLYHTAATSLITMLPAHYRGYPGLGYHYLGWNERGGDGTCVFYGGDASGILGWKLR